VVQEAFPQTFQSGLVLRGFPHYSFSAWPWSDSTISNGVVPKDSSPADVIPSKKSAGCRAVLACCSSVLIALGWSLPTIPAACLSAWSACNPVPNEMFVSEARVQGGQSRDTLRAWRIRIVARISEDELLVWLSGERVGL